MAQHDYVIDNGPGAAVRIDLQAALQALLSLNAGPVEPVTKYAGMLWLDTTFPPNGAIRMRDLSNATWTFPTLFGDDRVGEIAMFAFAALPSGWLKANGLAVSRSTYSALFTKIGTQYGVGDGSTTFNLPDLRGQFLRVWDDGKGIDTARAFGSTQAGAVINHAHTATLVVDAGGSHAHGGTAASAGAHTHTININTGGAHAHNISTLGITATAGPGKVGTAPPYHSSSTGLTTDTEAAHDHTASATSAGAHTHTITTDTEPAHAHTGTVTVASGGGGTETRPTNVALMACIRYA